MSQSDRERWDGKYAELEPLDRIVPDAWLRQCVTGLPAGRVLDVACGRGHNALWLAQQGWQVEGVDISPRGLQLVQSGAANHGLQVTTIAADLDEWCPAAERYDLVIVFRFLDRVRLPALIERGLKPGGYLVYETFSAAQMARADNHLQNPAFTVQPGEWDAWFPRYQVIEQSDVELADRSVGRLFARKPG